MTETKDLESLLKLLYPISCDTPLIRFGPFNDGGYLIPDDLNGIEACFSPGVSSVSGFEKECADRGIKVFLADRSVNNPAEEDELFHFTKKFIGSFSNSDFITIDNWVNASLPNSVDDLILQMDIESFEYETLLSMSEETLNRFRIMVIEFHSLDQLWNKPFFSIAGRAFQKIMQTHDCVHIHPNNIANTQTINNIEIITTMEFTFLRKDRIKNAKFTNKFPHELDSDNCTIHDSKILPTNWHHTS
ncbi:MAG: FkbM family methyltransferase [Candidatus Brocadiales bacterium]|nr:FkbM family methyltransferase [Candidatus Brocadiales bacterium]